MEFLQPKGYQLSKHRKMVDKAKPPTFGKFDSKHSDLLLARVAAFMPEIKAANEKLQNEDDVRVDDILIQEESDDDEEDESEKIEQNQPIVQLDVALGELESNKEVFDLLLPKSSSDDEEDDEKEQADDESDSRNTAEKSISTRLKCDDSKHKTSKVLIQEI